jgi:hypothetical protein
MKIIARDTSSPSAGRRRPRRRLVGIGATLLALGLLAAACSDDDDAGATTEAGEMTISFADPTDGATVGSSFDVQVDSNVEFGEPDTGLHHVHLYYDGNRSDDQSDYDIVYGKSFTVDRDLGDGEHTVEAVIANADHSLTDVSDEITVMVSGAASGSDTGGGGDTSETTDTTTDDPYGGY